MCICKHYLPLRFSQSIGSVCTVQALAGPDGMGKEVSAVSRDPMGPDHIKAYIA